MPTIKDKQTYRPGYFCEICNNPLLWTQTYPSLIKNGQGRFCSRKCQNQWRSKIFIGENSPSWRGGGVGKVCETCGKAFVICSAEDKKGSGRFCSRKCLGKWMSENLIGENGKNWRGGNVKQVCEMCSKIFAARPDLVKMGRGRFCSSKCMGQWQSENKTGKDNPNWNGGEVERACEVCGETFSVVPSVIERGSGRFCSRKCQGQWQSKNRTGQNSPVWKGGKIERTCEICDKTFAVYSVKTKKGHGRFCSRRCHGQWRSENWVGKNTSNWQGGKSFEPYPTSFNAPFKRKIRQRDGYICAICGAPDSKYVHHINYIKDDTVPKNCITLCRSCHGRTNGNRTHWQAILTKLIQDRAMEHYKVRFLGVEIHWVEEA